MTSDNERREVAERLRSVAREVDRGGFSETIKHVKLAVFEDLDRYRPNGTLDRLADLIEPGEPKVRCVAEVKVDGERLEKLAHDVAVEVTGIDRDALLALADECENGSKFTRTYKGSDPTCTLMATMLADEYGKIARRIRKALGATDG